MHFIAYIYYAAKPLLTDLHVQSTVKLFVWPHDFLPHAVVHTLLLQPHHTTIPEMLPRPWPWEGAPGAYQEHCLLPGTRTV